MINLERAEKSLVEPLIGDNELYVYVSDVDSSGFEGSINRYRNFDRNWHLPSHKIQIMRFMRLRLKR